MKIKNGIVFLEGVTGFSPGHQQTSFKDNTLTEIIIDNKDLVRLYEGLRHVIKERGYDWDKYCDDLFKDEK